MHAVMHHARPDGSPYPLQECRLYRRYAKGEYVTRRRRVLWRADGTGFAAEYWSHPVTRNGEILGAVVTFLDITERKRMEAAQREGEARFRLLFEKNPLPMWLFDAKTLKFLKVNDAAVTHYGYSREEFLGMRITDIRPPDDVPEFLHAFDHYLMAPGHSNEWKHHLKNGTTIDVTGHPGIPWRLDGTAGGSGSRAGHYSVEAGRAASHQKPRKLRRLPIAPKASSLTKVSHELHTPMNGIIGMLELALDAELSPQPNGKTSRMVRQSAPSVIEDHPRHPGFFPGLKQRNTTIWMRSGFDLRDNLGTAMQLLTPEARRKGLALTFDVEPTVPADL